MSKAAKPYSLAARVRSELAGTWGKIDSNEWRITCDLHEAHGVPDSGLDLVPSNIFGRATPLTAGSATGGGYLDQTDLSANYIPQLLPAMTLGRLGAKPIALDKNSTTIPHGNGAMAIAWLTGEATPTTATAQGFGQATVTRKTIVAETLVSRQLLMQSNIDTILPLELMRQSAAAIDLAGIQGIDGASGAPLGLLNIGSVPTASGATLTYAMLVSLMQQIAAANAVTDETKLGFLTSPVVAALLKQRYFSAANWPIWTGNIAGGLIDLQPALSSTNCPSASLIHGDFSQLLIAGWSDGLSISIDPFTNFQSGLTTIRLCISVDYAVPNPAGFSILTSIT